MNTLIWSAAYLLSDEQLLLSDTNITALSLQKNKK